MKKNIFQLTEEYLNRVGLEPISRIPAAVNIQAMSYEFDTCEDALAATTELLEMIDNWNLEFVEVYCRILSSKYFVTIEELDPDEFEEEE